MSRMDMVPVSLDVVLHLDAFHVGSGLRRGLTHRSVVRRPGGDIYIPGSSLKGRLRLHARQYLLGLGHAVCSGPDARAMCQVGEEPCSLCRIFGSAAIPGSLYFNDAHLVAEDQDLLGPGTKGLQTRLRTQVQISRQTGTAAEGHLYSTELAVGVRFAASVEGWLPAGTARADLAALAAATRLLDRIGANKSQGLGTCRCAELTLLVDGEQVTVASLLSPDAKEGAS